MRKRLNKLYDEHKDHDITLNQKVIKAIGLVINHVYFKCGSLKIPCIIYSTSMTRAKVIAKLEKSFFEKLKNHKNIVSLRFIFNKQSQIISFYINSKVRDYQIYDTEKEDHYYLELEFNNRSPDDLIDTLGSFIEKQALKQKRAEERFLLNSGPKEVLGLKQMENFLFIAGNGKRCLLTEISIFSAKIIINGKIGDFKRGDSVMLLMKSKMMNGLGEMMGYIERVEVIDGKEGIFSIIILFDQEKIPPKYKMWVAECIETIKFRS